MNSVIMTSYNGEKYIAEQIASILHCLNAEDELIISDDGSTDQTCDIIRSFSKNDGRIIFLQGPHKGLNENIKFLLSFVKGDIVFISDQDDIWNEDKVSTINDYFLKNPDTLVVHHNAYIIDGDGKPINNASLYEILKQPKSLMGFFFRARGFGSMIAFRKEFLKFDFIPASSIGCYDNGLMMYALRLHKLDYIDDCLIKYRRHSHNVSSFKRRNILQLICSRIRFFKFCLTNVFRLKAK